MIAWPSIFSGECGLDSSFWLVNISFWTGLDFKNVYQTCFDPETYKSVWAMHLLYDEIDERDVGTTGIPSSFDVDKFFPDLDVPTVYTKVKYIHLGTFINLGSYSSSWPEWSWSNFVLQKLLSFSPAEKIPTIVARAYFTFITPQC
jgi:hypothetical protein